MAFLTINGWEIPVAEVTKSDEYLGTYKRVFSGSLRDSTSAVKRKWNITTTPLTYDDAYTLRNILISKGDHFGFDNIAGNTGWDTTIGNFIVSDKGVVATAGTATWRPLEGPNGLNAIAVEKSTTNLLSQNTASFETDLTGWTITQTGITFSNPSDGGYHGSKYLKLVGSSGDTIWGITSPSITGISPGDSVTFSWYEKHNVNLSSITNNGYGSTAIRFYDSSDTEIANSAVFLTNLGYANTNWHRHYITATAPANTDHIRVSIGYDTPNLTSYHWHYIDAVQVEKKSYPTSFAYLSRSATNISFPIYGLYSPNELTVIISTLIEEKPSTSYYLCYLTTPNWTYNYTFKIYINPSTMTFEVYTPNYTYTYTILSSYSTNTWYNIGISFSSSKVLGYVNGSKVIDASTGYQLWYDSNATFNLGASTYFSQLVNNLLILPFAASGNFLAGATNINIYYKMPYVTISGDIVNNQQVMCFPEVQDADYLQFSNNGTWTTGQKVKFSLLEV